MSRSGFRQALVYFGLAEPTAEDRAAQAESEQVPLRRRIGAALIVAAVMSAFLVLVGASALRAVTFSVLLNGALLAVSLVLDRR